MKRYAEKGAKVVVEFKFNFSSSKIPVAMLTIGTWYISYWFGTLVPYAWPPVFDV